MNEEIRIIRKPAPVSDYQSLCDSVGWGKVNPENYELAVKNSINCIHALSGDKIVGSARLIGDVGLYFYVQDVVVDKAWQGQGIGKRLMEELHDIVKEMKTHRGKVSLIAALDVCEFYEVLGYAESKPESKFMVKKL